MMYLRDTVYLRHVTVNTAHKGDNNNNNNNNISLITRFDYSASKFGDL